MAYNVHYIVYFIWHTLNCLVSKYDWYRGEVDWYRLFIVFKDPGGTETEPPGSLVQAIFHVRL